MLKCSKNSEGTAELEEALATVLDILKSVNDSMHQIAITGFEVFAFAFGIACVLVARSSMSWLMISLLCRVI